jgi:hypothetical protein
MEWVDVTVGPALTTLRWPRRGVAAFQTTRRGENAARPANNTVSPQQYARFGRLGLKKSRPPLLSWIGLSTMKNRGAHPT